MKALKNLILILCGVVLIVSCQKELSVETGSTFGGLAVGSIKDTTGNCYPISVNGTYKTDSTLGDSNFVLVQINVTTPGNYKIISDSLNGFYFKDSGFITSPGMKTLKLKAIGKPISATQNIFTISFGTGFCSFTVETTARSTGGGGTGGGGGTNPNISDTAWQFAEGTKSYKGYFDTIYTQNVTGLGTVLSLEGYTRALPDTAFYIDILLPGTTVQPGTYVTAVNSTFYFLSDTSNVYYEADPSIAGVTMQIVITSYNATTKILKGTFNGTAKNKSGTTVTITNGRFEGKLN